MSFIEEWRSIAARIEGIRHAADLLSQFLQSHAREIYGGHKEIGRGCGDAFLSIEQFGTKYQGVIPAAAAECINNFTSDQRRELFTQAASDLGAMKSSTIMLLSVKAELDYLLSNQQERIRSRTERAFLHLQRLLAVDENARRLWMDAFKATGETACEKLGATHLLLHGIFAFKVNAEGARTDLVFSDLRDDFNSRGVEGLVLTEWKVGDSSNASIKFDAAKKQMNLYQRSALAGTELNFVRYAVLVSLEDIDQSALPLDEEIDGIVYRHINISITPRLPSVAARSRKKGGKD